MNAIETLLARGYWNQAGDDGSDAGGAGDAGSQDAGGDEGSQDGNPEESIAGDDGPTGDGDVGSIAGDDPGDDEGSGDDAADGDDKGEEGDKGDGKGEGAPEGGYAEFTVPEGAAPLNEELLAEFTTIASEAGMSQESAQQLIDMGYKLTANAAAEVNAELERNFQEQQKAWVGEIKQDPRFRNWEESVQVIRRGRAFFGGGVNTESNSALSAWLKDTGFGNHPMIVNGFYLIGQLVSPDGNIIAGATPEARDMAPEHRLYGPDPEPGGGE